MLAEELINQEDGNKSEEELEETLSLSDLVINDEAGGNNINDCFSMEKDQDFFEFYSQVDLSFPKRSFIFCGKIIHCRDDDNIRDGVDKHTNKNKSQMLEWNLQKTLSGRAVRVSRHNKERPWRWHLFAFGVGRHRMEMKQEEMKMRQMKPRSPTVKLFPVSNTGSRDKKGPFLWLRGLGCRDEFGTAVIRSPPSSKKVKQINVELN